ncbi:MAG: hypothetical protein IPN03_22435 [Holophagales bacterium]|nr:hypothetical protein [Holophagales bacterium]
MFISATFGFLALFLLATLAFWPRYISLLGSPIDPYTHLHAAFASLWCLLLIAQPVLVRRSRPLHRRLGAISYVIAPCFLVASVLLAHSRFRAMDEETFMREAPSLFLPLSAVALFSVSYILAIRHRHTMPLHARFMIATGLPMIDPVLGRLLFFFGPALPHPLHYQLVTFVVTDAVLLALLLRPRLAPSLRPAFIVPAALFPVLHVAWFTIVQRPEWVPFAAWFRRLPLS